MRTLLLAVVLSSAAGFGVQAASTAEWLEIAAGLPRQGQWRNGFDLADLDGDGRLDLAHGPARRQMGAPPRIFRGRAGLTFGRWDAASFPDLPFDYGDAAAADFDGDGHVDLVLAIHLRGLIVLLGDGRGRFSEQASFLAAKPGATVFSSRALSVGDLDADGRPDIVALGEGPRPRQGAAGITYGVRVLFNRLPEAWEWRELGPMTGRLFGDDLALGDFDQDGRLDIATASHVQGQRGVLFWGASGGDFVATELSAARPSSYIHALTSADFDGDGDDDLAIAYTDLQTPQARVGLDLMLSSGDRAWERLGLPWPEPDDRPTAVAAGDPDGDGDWDVVALTQTGALLAFVNSAGQFKLGPGLTSEKAGRGCRGYDLQLADLDGDGAEEILAGFADEHCSGGGSLRGWKWVMEAKNRVHP